MGAVKDSESVRDFAKGRFFKMPDNAGMGLIFSSALRDRLCFAPQSCLQAILRRV